LFARLVRSVVYAEREKDFVLASRSLGAGPFLIVLRHILPNILPSLIVLITLSIGNAILSAAALGFLGLGAQPPTPEWGNLVNIGQEFMREAPWLVWFPGLAIVATVLGANMLGDGLRDALDPKLRR
jgi:ABC-type dipeptide/oligopeptide/nickel transport system permease subunit